MAIPIVLAPVAVIRRRGDPPHHAVQHPLGMANDADLVADPWWSFITQSRPVRIMCGDDTHYILDTYTKKLIKFTAGPHPFNPYA